MISKNLLKQVSSYKQKKFRDQDNVFVVEGNKCVRELLNSDFEIVSIFALESWIKENKLANDNVFAVSEKELERMSNLSTPDKVLAVAKQKTFLKPNVQGILTLVLDDISNPGNLGTIIRLATWFGIKNIVCSNDTVECFNPKVVQATMGAIFHTNIFYTDIAKFLNTIDKSFPIYSTVLEGGKNIYKEKLTKEGLIIIGNESRGISNQVKQKVNRPLTIPSFAENKEVESLNASIAAAIILSEFRRN